MSIQDYDFTNKEQIIWVSILCFTPVQFTQHKFMVAMVVFISCRIIYVEIHILLLKGAAVLLMSMEK